jgi:hypothetical protein
MAPRHTLGLPATRTGVVVVAPETCVVPGRDADSKRRKRRSPSTDFEVSETSEIFCVPGRDTVTRRGKRRGGRLEADPTEAGWKPASVGPPAAPCEPFAGRCPTLFLNVVFSALSPAKLVILI